MTGKVYADSNVLIYQIDGSEPLRTSAKIALASVIHGGQQVFSSEIAVGECLRGAWKHGKPRVDIYLDMFSDADFISLAPVTIEIMKRAAFLGAELNMKLLDAIHVATAESLGCNIFLTNDRGIRTPAGIELRYLTVEP